MSNTIKQKHLDVIGEVDFVAKWVARKEDTRYDGVEYGCKKGLWSVYGSIEDDEKLKQQALQYFIQYYIDGEYN